MLTEETSSQEAQELSESEMIDDQFTDDSVKVNKSKITLPTKIKRVRIFIAIAQLVTGILMTVFAIWYFVAPVFETTRLDALGVLLIIVGGGLIIAFPFSISRPINSCLELGTKNVNMRNLFRWKSFKWADIQEIMITERLSNDPNINKPVGLGLIRFRTVSENGYYFADSFTKDDVKIVEDSIYHAFAATLQDSDYKVEIESERPSMKTRLIYLKKVTK
ncbi:MAG: hypothetical protein ACTSPT_00750 [Candidatus Heimdallarchaeota archaeon]